MLRLISQTMLAVLVLHSGVTDCWSQAPDTLIKTLTKIASFEEATALDIDPAGIIYVVDKGTHSVIQLSLAGEELSQLGGPGEGEGQFDYPADIDVTNGLVLVVADAGNGRIQRFSRNFLFLESLPVDVNEREGGDTFGSEPAYRQGEQSVDSFGSGRPIALVTSSDNNMYAVDEASNVVVKWDKNRNIEQYIGSYDQGHGSLVEPVSIAINDRGTLFVADQGLASIQVYDAFGGFDRSMAAGLCAEVLAISVEGELLIAVLPGKILVFQSRGLLERTVRFELDEPFADVAIHNDVLYLLTENSLYEMPSSVLYP